MTIIYGQLAWNTIQHMSVVFLKVTSPRIQGWEELGHKILKDTNRPLHVYVFLIDMGVSDLYGTLELRQKIQG